MAQRQGTGAAAAAGSSLITPGSLSAQASGVLERARVEPGKPSSTSFHHSLHWFWLTIWAAKVICRGFAERRGGAYHKLASKMKTSWMLILIPSGFNKKKKKRQMSNQSASNCWGPQAMLRVACSVLIKPGQMDTWGLCPGASKSEGCLYHMKALKGRKFSPLLHQYTSPPWSTHPLKLINKWIHRELID